MIPLHSTSTHTNSQTNSQTGCHVDPIAKPVDPHRLDEAAISYLLVSGMGCPACAMRVHNALLQQDGVLAVDVALAKGVAKVTYDDKVVTPEDMPAAVATAGQDGRHHYAAQVLTMG